MLGFLSHHEWIIDRVQVQELITSGFLYFVAGRMICLAASTQYQIQKSEEALWGLTHMRITDVVLRVFRAGPPEAQSRAYTPQAVRDRLTKHQKWDDSTIRNVFIRSIGTPRRHPTHIHYNPPPNQVNNVVNDFMKLTFGYPLEDMTLYIHNTRLFNEKLEPAALHKNLWHDPGPNYITQPMSVRLGGTHRASPVEGVCEAICADSPAVAIQANPLDSEEMFDIQLKANLATSAKGEPSAHWTAFKNLCRINGIGYPLVQRLMVHHTD